MEAKPPSSFIPKQTLSEHIRPIRSSNIGVLAVISMVVFLVSVAVAGGMFLYQNALQEQLTGLEAEIQEGKAAFKLEEIDSIRKFVERVEISKGLLGKHVSFARLFLLLEENTLPSVAFSTLSYKTLEDGSAQIELSGITDGFASLALQSDQFVGRQELRQIRFSSFDLDKGGRVKFQFSAIVDRQAITYAPQAI